MRRCSHGQLVPGGSWRAYTAAAIELPFSGPGRAAAAAVAVPRITSHRAATTSRSRPSDQCPSSSSSGGARAQIDIDDDGGCVAKYNVINNNYSSAIRMLQSPGG